MRSADDGGAAPFKVYVKRATSVNFAEVEVPVSASVAFLKEAITTKLRLDVPGNLVTLTVEGADKALDSTLTVEESVAARALAPRAKLFVAVQAQPAAAAATVDAGE